MLERKKLKLKLKKKRQNFLANPISLQIVHPSSLELMVSNKELCKYLNKMIKNLDIDRYSQYQSKMSTKINPLYEIKEKKKL